MKKPVRRIDASRFQNKLDRLGETVVRRIQDEWPSELHDYSFAQLCLVSSLRYCLYAYRAGCEMFCDERRTDHRWTWDKLVVFPPINRAVLDSLFNVVFMLEDVANRSKWYLRSGWKEQKLEYDRFLAAYAGDPEWAEWLEKANQLIQEGVVRFGISEQEIAEPKSIQSWPSSGQMPDYGVNPSNHPNNREFLQYLSDWFYREHSGMAHMSFLGLLKLSSVLHGPDLPKEQRDQLEQDGLPRTMTSHMMRSAILLLCVLSELQSHFRFSGDIELRLLEIWHVILPDSLEAQELHNKRYQALFPALLLSGPEEQPDNE